MKFAVVGLGYVGFSLAYLISKKDLVVGIDTNLEKVDLINQKIVPIQDLDSNINVEDLNFHAESSLKDVISSDIDCYIIATPTNYDKKLKSLDTSIVESVIKTIYSLHQNSFIVIKSTVPLCSKLNIDNCFFMILYIFTTIRLFLLSVHEIRIDAQKKPAKLLAFLCVFEC